MAMRANFFFQTLCIILILISQTLFSSAAPILAESCRTSEDCERLQRCIGGVSGPRTPRANFCECIGSICVRNVPGTYRDFTQTNALAALVSRFYLIIIIPLGAIGFLFFLISGYQFLMSKGDPKALEAAKARLTYAIIGLIIIFLAGAITNLVFNRFSLWTPVE